MSCVLTTRHGAPVWSAWRIASSFAVRCAGHMEAQLVELAVAADHFRFAAGIQLDAAARLGRLAGAHLRPRGVLRQQALDQDLHAAAAFLLPEQARRNHTGVVENQQIARLQPFGQVADVAIRERRVA